MAVSTKSSILDLSLSAQCTRSPEESHEAWAQCKNAGRQLPEYKAVVVGASGVGKSALTIQMTHHCFVKDHDPTIQDSYWKQVALDNGGYVLNVLDTAGQDIHRALRDQCLAAGDGVLGVFALDDPSSLEQLQQIWSTWSPDQKQPLVLVGNKCDLVTTAGAGDAHAAAAILAHKWGAPFVKTSAKTRQGVEEAFDLLVHEIQRAQEAMAEPSKEARHRKAVCSCGCSVA
ncbi:GTPase ERas [Peromyscus maniculatus bairdii]|uniref:small monomeric GTPase n=1 Tax=Peromyscus maniculatus bairdii TaxID=230844 RepID=A0A6I9MIM1_PERMB|nr:GTPase ERas [Peromyscus maniculatus bairdii]XP_015846077.1 GTPase ERas [Peromyscus maniculatus bairdii]XP_042125168.1 GTPase ERas [Peromyscus maniculatus bairdii]